jgi:putative ubiquitin-RnfH superfamily antitoxin RatB of RatAB toxin-antitoxin module
MSDHKRFSKQEISQILSKASEIQRSKNISDSAQEGVTTSELREIAHEVGISNEVLDKAIHSFENRADIGFNWVIGTGELQSATVIEGEISELQLDQLFPELNVITGKKGIFEQVGKSYEWEQVENGLESVRRVTILPKDGKTKVIHYVNWNDLRSLGLGLSAFLGALGLALILKAFGIEKSTYLLLSSIGAIVGYFGFMGGLKFYFDHQKKKFESIMQLITDTLEKPPQHRAQMDEAPIEDSINPIQRNKTKS